MRRLMCLALTLCIGATASKALATDAVLSLLPIEAELQALLGLGDDLLGGASSLLAGNPGSLLTQTVDNTFALVLDTSLEQLNLVFDEVGDIPNLFGLSFTVGEFETNGVKISYVTLPLTYTFRSQRILGRQWILSMPLTQGEVNDAKTYSIQPGLALRLPVSANWAITPGMSVGYVKSSDLDQEAEQAGVSVSSAYRIPLGSTPNSIYIGNLVGYYKTLKVTLAGKEFDPNMANTVFRNGLLYSMPMAFAHELLSVELSLVNTLFKGTDTYTRSQNELAVSVGSTRRHMAQLSFLRVGLAVIQAEDIRGFRLNFGYYF
ncbi:hypothetical protein [Zhongshania aliphaticivorans]|uniref:hypothetical protein n=1 Tax=Zhongshania aliphaticivorans TaxID=1470434 RepID=UPI0039C92663